MNAQHLDLLERLKRFPLDSADAALPFSARLARENGWSAAYTRRVIAEYKRFAFLAVAAGHPVSPPEDVDQAWHLHLTCSENYWNVFCREVLGKPLHHQPTRGGHNEREKFDDWYTRTLASYEAHFGERPPADIWPSPEARSAEHHEFVRVDRARCWVIPKPRMPRLSSRRLYGARLHPLPAFAAIAMVLIVCSGAILAQAVNPLDLPGPQFLGFYVGLACVCLGGATWLRWAMRKPADLPLDKVPQLDPYAMAYLNGGRVLTVNAALANLANQEVLRLDLAGKRIHDVSKPPAATHPLERAILAPVRASDSTGVSLANVRTAARPAVEEIAQDLQDRKLVLTDEQARKALRLPLMLAGLVPLIGVVKIAVGLSRGKPVMALVMLCIMSAGVVLVAFGRRPLRTRRGDVMLNGLKSQHWKLCRLQNKLASVSPLEFATGVGLFGLVALEGTALAGLSKTLQPPGGSGGCGSSCGSGCGGGGCGGCGGGCGGCGGD